MYITEFNWQHIRFVLLLKMVYAILRNFIKRYKSFDWINEALSPP